MDKRKIVAAFLWITTISFYAGATIGKMSVLLNAGMFVVWLGSIIVFAKKLGEY